MAGVALSFPAEQLVAQLLLRGELRLARLHRVELRRECRHLGRCLIAGDRLRHLVECRGGASAIELAEMDRHWIVGRCGPGLVTDLLHVLRPRDREGLLAPNSFEQRTIGPLRRAIDRAGDVGQAHLDRIGRRSLRLFGRRVAQSASGRTHVPEIAADQITLAGIVMQHG